MPHPDRWETSSMEQGSKESRLGPYRTREIVKEEKLSIPDAERIMGRENFFGPSAVEKAFKGIMLGPEDIPDIPFSQEELERAKELGQVLILQINKAPDGEPLTIKKMTELHQSRSIRTRKCKISHWFLGDDKKEKFLTIDTPKPSWVLVSKEFIPNLNLENKESINYLDQTQALAEYLKNRVFEGKELPPHYQEAIDEFNALYEKLRGNTIVDRLRYIPLPERSEIPDDILDILTEKLPKLKINKLVRPSPVDAMYDIIICSQIFPVKNSKKGTASCIFTSCSFSINDEVVSVGCEEGKGYQYLFIRLEGMFSKVGGNKGVLFFRTP
jgi:hypothetical protein